MKYFGGWPFFIHFQSYFLWINYKENRREKIDNWGVQESFPCALPYFYTKPCQQYYISNYSYSQVTVGDGWGWKSLDDKRRPGDSTRFLFHESKYLIRKSQNKEKVKNNIPAHIWAIDWATRFLKIGQWPENHTSLCLGISAISF